MARRPIVRPVTRPVTRAVRDPRLSGGSGGGGGSVTYVDSTATNGIGTDFIISTPVGVDIGDLLVMFVYFSNHVRALQSVSDGFTPAIVSEPGSLDNFYVYTKVATDAEPASYTVANDGITDRAAIVCVALRGAGGINGNSAVSRSNGTGANATASFTTTLGGYQLAVFCTDDSAAAPTVTSAPAGFTELELNRAAFSHMWVGGRSGVGAGTQSAVSLTWSSGSAFNRTNISLVAA